jgi:hypothetical protein
MIEELRDPGRSNRGSCGGRQSISVFLAVLTVNNAVAVRGGRGMSLEI